MSFQPVLPFGGIAGWSVLQRTREDQQAAFERSPQITRDTTYFAEKIGSISTPDELVSDYRLLRVALGAFGLDEDIGNKFFVRKALEEGTIAEDSFANRLSDKRYRALSEAFGFDLSPPNTKLSTFSVEIISAYEDRRFEAAIGQQDPDMRLALGLGRELQMAADRNISSDGLWYSIMGTAPLREVFVAGLGIPRGLEQADLDRQVELMKSQSMQRFGTDDVRDFLEPVRQESLVKHFLIGAQIRDMNVSSISSGAVALSLLQGTASQGL